MSQEIFVLIPGRTAKQGSSLNVGKYTDEYIQETQTLFCNEEDMQRLGLVPGDRVRLDSAQGNAELRCQKGPKGEIPPGLLFLPYGPPVCALIGGETHGTGMPDSKGLDVTLTRLADD